MTLQQEVERMREVIRVITAGNDGRYPALSICSSERLIPRGAWRNLCDARYYDVRYVTISGVRHLSYYSMLHVIEFDGVKTPHPDVRTLCGLPFAIGQTRFGEQRGHTPQECASCERIARGRHLVIMERAYDVGDHS